MATLQFDLRTSRELLVDWVMRLAKDAGLPFSQRGGGPERFTIGSPNDFNLTTNAIEHPPFLQFVASDVGRQDEIDALVAEAARRVTAGDLGQGVWYSTELVEVPWSIGSFSVMGSLMHRLGMQVPITGWRRLGGNVLLEFTEKADEGEEPAPRLLAKHAIVHTHIFVPGPIDGFLSSRIVHGAIESIGAVCAFALGRPVVLPPTVFSAPDEEASKLDRSRVDPAVLTLARKGVPLDIFSYIGVPGGLQVFERSRAALITYDAAVQQERDTVACILYVVAAECLTVPPTDWRHEKLTTRFIKFFDELMPNELDTIVRHGNFEEAFGIRRGNRGERALRRELLDYLYDYRSGQLHEGLASSYRGFALGGDMGQEMRRGLFADFAEGAIIRFLASPRCTVVGHPAFQPPLPLSAGAA